MIKALENAVAKIGKLPEDQQAYAAELLELMAERSSEDVFVIPDDHLAGIFEGLAQTERGEFASDEDVAALWKKYGL